MGVAYNSKVAGTVAIEGVNAPQAKLLLQGQVALPRTGLQAGTGPYVYYFLQKLERGISPWLCLLS